MRPEPVAIVGANGHVGRRVAHRAEQAGVTVRRVGRHDDAQAAVAGVGRVIHLAGTLQAIGGNSYEGANVGTVRRTIAAARDAGARRVVFLSYVGADAGAKNDYLRTKGEAEELLRASGLDAVVLRSTVIFGPPEDPGPSIAPFIQTSGKPVSIIGTGRQRYQPVFVDDVAEALLRALDPDVPGGTYALAGPDVLVVDELVSLLNGRAVKERHFAGLIARAVATVAPTLTQAMVGVLSADSLPDVGPAWDTFGITPRSVHDVYNAVGAG